VVDSISHEETREHFDVDHAFIAHLNGECFDWASMDNEALQRAIHAQGDDWSGLVKERCPHVFAAAPVFISELQLQQMHAVIAAVEEVAGAPEAKSALGVFYGYDFHLNEQGVHLIEINTNAGGAFLNALLIESQHGLFLYGTAVAEHRLEQVFIDMFRNEWSMVRGDAALKTIAIVDEQPESQYLYPEFLLMQKIFEREGYAVHIVDPSALQAREDGLYCDEERVDLIYNRLTDFDLHQFPHIRAAWDEQQVVLTPNPAHYRRYADKRKLTQFSDREWLRSSGVSQAGIDALLQGVPQTRLVQAQDADQWWSERKQWFFKPVSGYGSKGAYRGDKLTKRVFEEIMQSDYVAQRMAQPDERKVCAEGAEPQLLKFDVRCYVYDGNIQLVAARLYQGQTTNFRTPGGGFALVREVT
jgi:glutathione synthase/RimK-type ligase-like ATP-grasp enzyme